VENDYFLHVFKNIHIAFPLSYWDKQGTTITGMVLKRKELFCPERAVHSMCRQCKCMCKFWMLWRSSHPVRAAALLLGALFLCEGKGKRKPCFSAEKRASRSILSLERKGQEEALFLCEGMGTRKPCFSAEQRASRSILSLRRKGQGEALFVCEGMGKRKGLGEGEGPWEGGGALPVQAKSVQALPVEAMSVQAQALQ
jgi:hypothetical protein